MKTLLIFGFLALVTPVVWAGDAGTTSANFLKLGVGPRAVGMGQAHVAVADDVYATYWNPAGLTQLSVPELGFAHNQYIQDITEQFAAYAHPTRLGTFAGSLTYLGVGKFEGYDAAGQPSASVGASDMALALSYARPIWEDRRAGSFLSVGATGKYLRESLDTVSASAVAFDGGALFEPGRRWGDIFEGWRVGLALRQVGSSLKFDQESFPLPRTLAAGVSWTGLWLGESLTVAFDGEQPRDGARVLNTGLELWTLRTLVLRVGYTSQSDLGNGVRAGVGLQFKIVQLDYAYAGAGAFGSAHRIGITLRWATPPTSSLTQADRYYHRGLEAFKKGRYPEALLDFNKSLELDPAHPRAFEMMKQTYEHLKPHPAP